MSDEPSLLSRLLSSDVEELLGDDETVFVSIKPSRWDESYLRHYLSACVIFLIGAGILLFRFSLSLDIITAVGAAIVLFAATWLGVIEIRLHFERYHFTDTKVIAETGMVNREFTTVAYKMVTHVDMHQSMLQRFLDIADFELNTAGTDLSEMWVNGVRQPLYLTEKETLFSFLQRTTGREQGNY